ncbi:MAG: protein phosphatase 2C domain-containing protein [Armatimonadetes bacterium]|nr:protein phosphatase 2C domain-containing protein [Armatimonadota bacterium]
MSWFRRRKEPQWILFGSTVIGATHIRKGKPNQDDLMMGRDGTRAGFVALADGHGGERYTRSDEGARAAVECAGQLLLDILAGGSVDNFGQKLVERWRAAVSELGDDPIPFGSTALGVAVTPERIFAYRLGDGDVLAVSEAGQVIDLFESGNADLGDDTNSLCTENAANLFQIVDHPIDHWQPTMLFASTDGYAKSFQDRAGFLAVASDLYQAARQQGPEVVEAELEGWLRQTSDQGSGDDITVGVILRTS